MVDLIQKAVTALFAKLDGKKTYIAAAASFALAVYDVLGPQHDVIGAWQAFSTGLGLLGLRHAIAKGF